MQAIDDHLRAVYQIIHGSLAYCQEAQFPEFHRLLESAFVDRMPAKGLPWLMLPVWTCEALGGEVGRAHQVAAALEIGRIAAGCLDEWQDHDTEGALWQAIGAERAVNAATGMLALSSLVVAQLAGLGVPAEQVLELGREFQLTQLHMCEGQDADLSDGVPLGGYEAIAGAKSGALFRLACRAGALVAGASAGVADLYGDLGYNLGVLVQLGNDLQGMAGARGKGDADHIRALPAIASHALGATAHEAASSEGQAGQWYSLVRLQVYHDRAAKALSGCPEQGQLGLFLEAYSIQNLVGSAAPTGAQGA
jgi:geranylgeranyl diphosphate synthase type I